MPTLEALLAGSLALMTGYAQSSPACPSRHQLAGKIAANLAALVDHPQLSEPMHVLLARLLNNWEETTRDCAQYKLIQPATALWHTSPVTVQ